MDTKSIYRIIATLPAHNATRKEPFFTVYRGRRCREYRPKSVAALIDWLKTLMDHKTDWYPYCNQITFTPRRER